MQSVYIVIRNFLLFFFLVSIFATGINISQGLVGKILLGILFGLVMLVVPTVLGFFKLPVNFWSMVLLGTVLSFIFFFLLKSGFLGLASFASKTTIDWGISGLKAWVLDDIGTLVLISIAAAFASVGLDNISGIKRK